MRLISFMWFKQNCKHYDEELSADLDKPICTLNYGKCSEKRCPVLHECKDVKKCLK